MHAIQHDYRQLRVLINNAGVFFMRLSIRTPLTAAEEMTRMMTVETGEAALHRR